MSGIRMSGMASGMDTETMVKNLMKAERVKVDKIKQSKELSKVRQEQYNEANKSIAQFILDTKTEIFGTYSYSKSVDSLDWVKKATSSNESIFTAKASAKAVEGTHKIKVKQLAEGVSIASQSAVKDMVTGETATGSSFVKDLEGFAVGDFEINGELIKIEAGTTVDNLVKQINDSDAKVQANFDKGRLFLSTKETGAEAKIKITKDSQGLFIGNDNKFKLLKDNDVTPDPNDKIAVFADVTTEEKGTNAIINFDGAENLEYDSNNISINGIDINLNSADPNKDIILKVDTDVDSVYDKIKGFVDKYNELIGNLNKKTSEKRYRDFNPLTAEQKEAMKENDIKLWQEKAKSGLLRNDEHIEKLVQKVRKGLYDPSNEGEGAFDQLFEIGITTGEWKSKGKLVISDDPNKGLKAKIKEDPKAVLDLLFAPSDPSDSSKSGIVNRMYDDMIDGMKEIVDKSGTGDDAEIYRNVKTNMLIEFVTGGPGRRGSISLIDEDILKFDKSISREESRLTDIENGYWRKFTAMEKALSQLQSQSSWMTSQLGGM